MNQWLNYHHLLYFKVIATEGSIAKAAERLRLGQPTLSAQLKTFEDTLGHALFERKNRRLVLTESGRIALEYATAIFRTGDEMLDALNDRHEKTRVRAQLGALDGIAKRILLAVTRAAQAGDSALLSVYEGKSEELLRDLLSHRIDLLLTNFVPSAPEGEKIHSRHVARLPVGIYGAPKFKSLRKDFPASLAGANFVMPTTQSRLRLDLDHFLETQKLHVAPVAETQDTSLQILMGVDGAGLVAVSEFAAADLVREGKLVELGRPAGLHEDIYFVTASRRMENPVVARLMKSFRLE